MKGGGEVRGRQVAPLAAAPLLELDVALAGPLPHDDLRRAASEQAASAEQEAARAEELGRRATQAEQRTSREGQSAGRHDEKAAELEEKL